MDKHVNVLVRVNVNVMKCLMVSSRVRLRSGARARSRGKMAGFASSLSVKGERVVCFALVTIAGRTSLSHDDRPTPRTKRRPIFTEERPPLYASVPVCFISYGAPLGKNGSERALRYASSTIRSSKSSSERWRLSRANEASSDSGQVAMRRIA